MRVLVRLHVDQGLHARCVDEFYDVVLPFLPLAVAAGEVEPGAAAGVIRVDNDTPKPKR